MNRSFFTALRGHAAFETFLSTNKNTANSYRSGYEYYMDDIPIVTDADTHFERIGKLASMELTIKKLANEIKNQLWIWQDWPEPGTMLTRAFLAIDGATGAQIVLVRWNTIETPIHGHQYGQMLDMLLHGEAMEVDYKVVDAEKRLVEAVGSKAFCGQNILSNTYTSPSELVKGAVIHKFKTLKRSVTLHFIPEMPPDGKGNLFTEVTPMLHDSINH